MIGRKIEHFNGFHADPAKEIVVTVGSTGGFATATMSTLNAGDEVILFEPYYGYHYNTLRVLGVVTKFVPLREPDWSLDFDQLRAAFGPTGRPRRADASHRSGRTRPQASRAPRSAQARADPSY